MAKIKKVQAVQAVQAVTNYPMVINGKLPTLKTRAITYAHTVKAEKLASDMATYKTLAIQAAQNEMAGIKPTITPNKPLASKLNAFGNSKGYGDKTPKTGTSAAMIWQACVDLGITQTSVTKLYIDTIHSMGLMCANGKPVNYANIGIEVNSYKKWLKNHAG